MGPKFADDPANPPPAEHVLNFDTSPPTNEEVKLAIKGMKGGKAAGVGLFRNFWEKKTIPADWDEGLIVKIPKKGNHQNGDNWRGITLLSIPSKVFCRILIGRIDSAVDQTLMDRQDSEERDDAQIRSLL